jgi:hypothetical protein
MSRPRRVTVHLDYEVHLALRDKAAATGQSVSHLVNEAVRRSLAEDADDLAAYRGRAREPELDFASVLKEMRRRGKL